MRIETILNCVEVASRSRLFSFFHGKDPKKQVHNPVEKWNKRKKKRNKEEKKE